MPEIGRILAQASHRPWPLPRAPWMMFQSWRTLLFAHWPVEPDALARLVPAPLEPDLRDGHAWVGVTPFFLTGLRLRMMPPLPGASRFPEVNLRTYVRYGGRTGIFFFSLDAASGAAVAGARAFFRLPYRRARIKMTTGEDGWTTFRSRRRDGRAELNARYRPAGPAAAPAPGTLEAFLTERYTLFTVLRNGKVLRADVHHGPWLLHAAEGELDAGALAEEEGVPLPATEPLLHFSQRQDTVVWPPVPGDR
jgi:uncharacterized protein